MEDWDELVCDDSNWIIVSIREIFKSDYEIFVVEPHENIENLNEKWLNAFFLKS